MTDFAVDELPLASALDGTELLYGLQGSTDVGITPSQVADYILGRADTSELIRDVVGATLVAGSGISISVDDSPNTITISATGSSAFNGITGGTNTTAAMIVGTGASLSATGSGTIHATSSDTLHTARTIGGVSFNGSANITVASATGGFTVSGGDLALGANNLTMTGSIGATGARVTKGWFTDLQCTNAMAGDITGNAATASAVAAANLTGATLAAGVTASSLTSVGTLTGLAVAGQVAITSTNAAGFAVGANGSTTPVLNIDCSVASQVSGITIQGKASGSGVTITATGGTNEAITISSKGNGAATLVGGSSLALSVSGGSPVSLTTSSITFTNTSRSSTANSMFVFTALASGTGGSSLTAGSEVLGLYVNLAATQTHASNTGITTQRDIRLVGSTHAFQTATGTITDAMAVYIAGAPIAGTNCAITTGHALYIAAAAVGSGTAASYGLTVNPQTGATANYGSQLLGLNGLGRGTPTAFADIAASTTASASLRIRSGTAPTSPNEGDMWYDGTNLKFRDSSTSRTITWT